MTALRTAIDRQHTHQLVSEQKDGLETELASTKVEQVFQRRAQKVEDHAVVVTLDAVPANERNADWSGVSDVLRPTMDQSVEPEGVCGPRW